MILKKRNYITIKITLLLIDDANDIILHRYKFLYYDRNEIYAVDVYIEHIPRLKTQISLRDDNHYQKLKQFILKRTTWTGVTMIKMKDISALQ